MSQRNSQQNMLKFSISLFLVAILSACGGGGGTTGSSGASPTNTPPATIPTTGTSPKFPLTALNLSGTVHSFPYVSMASCAGGPLDGNVYGSALSAPAFCVPDALTTDGSSLFVVDNWLLQPSYGVIRKIDLTTGVTTSIAGSWTWKLFGPSGSTFNMPKGITITGSSLYLADTGNHVIRKIDIATGNTTTFAGALPTTVGGAGGFTDGSALNARFNTPSGITTDGKSLFIADTLNRAIRMIDIASGTTSTLAGNPLVVGILTDGTGANARFVSPTAITTDGINLYVIDSNSIRQVAITSGTVVTLAGSTVSGYIDSNTGISARFNLPHSIATDGVNIFVTDNARVREIAISSGVVTTLAGGGTGIQADGIGNTASFAGMWAGTYPYGVTSDGSKIYVGDRQAIRTIQ